MKTFRVQLNSIGDVRRFVDTATQQTCDIVIREPNIVVDAKSLLDMFSLDLSHPLEVVFQGEGECADTFYQQLARFVKVQPCDEKEEAK